MLIVHMVDLPLIRFVSPNIRLHSSKLSVRTLHVSETIYLKRLQLHSAPMSLSRQLRIEDSKVQFIHSLRSVLTFSCTAHRHTCAPMNAKNFSTDDRMILVALSLLIGKHASISLTLASSVPFRSVGHGVYVYNAAFHDVQTELYDWRVGIKGKMVLKYVCSIQARLRPMTK